MEDSLSGKKRNLNENETAANIFGDIVFVFATTFFENDFIDLAHRHPPF